MNNQSQYGDTILLRDLQGESSTEKLTRIDLAGRSNVTRYNESWLQNLIMKQPGLLPIGQIEPAFSTIVPVCTELPMRSGFADNLFVTPSGDIAIVECKLWRNPEARRKVIAQIIDYASEMTTWNYESLDSAIRRAKMVEHSGEGSSRNLYEIVSSSDEVDEIAFHDAVSRNLRRGRFHLLILGDGIREGLETLTEYLQKHAGLHFTLSLVELALFELSTGGLIVQPRILARTTNIDRGTVTLQDGRMNITLPPQAATSSPLTTRGINITQEHFLEQLEKNCPGISGRLTSFINELASSNVAPDVRSKTMTLRWHTEDGKGWNLGSIVDSGEVWMDYHGQQARNFNVLNLSQNYLENVASIVPGAIVKMTKNQTAWNAVDANGHSLRIEELLLDDTRRNAWIRAIVLFQAAVSKQLEN